METKQGRTALLQPGVDSTEVTTTWHLAKLQLAICDVAEMADNCPGSSAPLIVMFFGSHHAPLCPCLSMLWSRQERKVPQRRSQAGPKDQVHRSSRLPSWYPQVKWAQFHSKRQLVVVIPPLAAAPCDRSKAVKRRTVHITRLGPWGFHSMGRLVLKHPSLGVHITHRAIASRGRIQAPSSHRCLFSSQDHSNSQFVLQAPSLGVLEANKHLCSSTTQRM